MINQLIDILGREAGMFETFLALLERQQHALIENDLDELQTVTEQMHEKSVESQLLSRSREQLIAQIKNANAIDGDFSVSNLLDMVSESDADRLRELRQLIIELNDKVTYTRNQNAMLLNRSRAYIHRIMETLAKVDRSDDTYGASGTNPERQRHVAIDGRV